VLNACILASTMKLIADVEVVNRLLPTANIRSRSRPKRAQLCVGRKCSGGSSSSSSSDGHNVELLVTSQNDRLGTQYKVGIRWFKKLSTHIFSSFLCCISVDHGLRLPLYCIIYIKKLQAIHLMLYKR